jgi:exonuclease I
VNTSVPVQNITKVNEKVKITNEIKKEIAAIYSSELPFANIEDTSAQQLQGRFLELHTNLIQTIKRLDEIIPISQKVCNDQGT